METFDHEKHCHFCRQRDYLPTLCSHCNLYFCSDHLHYQQHQCLHFEQDSNVVSEEELRREESKRKQRRRTSKGCTHKSCKQPWTSLLITCSSCQQKYCLSHRLPEDHTCNSPALREKERIKRLNAKKPVQNHIPTPLSRRTIPLMIQTRKPLDSLQFSNTKTERVMPVYKPNLLKENQGLFDILFPFDAHLHPLHFVVCTTWKVGKLLDTLCTQANIRRQSMGLEASSTTNIHLYSIRTGMRLRDNDRLSELLQTGELRDEDALILERGSREEQRMPLRVMSQLWNLSQNAKADDETQVIRRHLESLQNEMMKEIMVTS